ncbi:hypothetical protein PTSG_11606 [Salpingoeca rosetta]|uniref:Uncharacterized protein n=1 Tax=Salpingoeca rosetta (strain ATCC 50818 / BSB-021) TaxID=946362 RepID=F2TWR6_SALR5|nr:uncharacterized protein PTSG_11606 [Salpingoeca rosetta]EGD72512.1 hypothetical protein PTSG_11606 [Salpingoeca rosetta]|eukprot:XP_004999081.1 hypothetical protein PTSG_11606 [Salpingoeca rosetta]
MSDPSDHVVSTPGFKMDLPKFTGSPGTFHAWSIRMKMALKLRGDDVWAAVEAGASSSGGPSSATRSSARRPTAGDHANITAANLIASTVDRQVLSAESSLTSRLHDTTNLHSPLLCSGMFT